MISIIVSTHKPEFFQRFSENLKKTIGIEYELIGIENYAQYSICEAYNLGIKLAKYPFLCFVHEDIIFKTQNWGKRMISLMENDQNIGLIGVAGSKFKSSYPLSGWGQGPSLNKFKRGQITHYYDNNELYEDFDFSTEKKEFEEVVCLDGIFLFTKNEVLNHCKFDDKTLNYFHGYDTDFSLQVFFKNYKVIVDRKIELIHYSKGNYNKEYTQANKKIWKKWLFKLPVASKDLKMSKLDRLKTDIINWYYSGNDTIKRKLKML